MKVWGQMTREEMERRNGHILELWQMGFDRREIARIVDLTPERISQILKAVR